MGIFFVDILLGGCRVYIRAASMDCTWGKHFRGDFRKMKKKDRDVKIQYKSRQQAQMQLRIQARRITLGEPNGSQ